MAPVLVVDDDPGIREMLSDILSLEGCQVLTARDGREALRVMREAPQPAVVLLNLMMPVLRGMGVMRELSEDPELRARHVIFLMSGMIDLERMARELGADGALTKPFSIEHLLAAVQRGQQDLRRRQMKEDPGMATVLAIHANPAMREVTRDLLAMRGYEVITAPHGREGLDILRVAPSPLIVLLDVNTPVMDGRAVLRSLHADPALRAKHALIVWSAAANLEPFANHPAVDGTLALPFSVDGLLAAVEHGAQVLRRRHSEAT